MHDDRRHGLLAAALFVAGLAGMAVGPACGGWPHDRREPAMAPELNAISDDQLHSAMGQLAVGVTELHSILGDRGPVTPSERLEVLRILDRMQVAADALGPDDVPSGHPRIDRNLGRFREKLEIARESVAMEPPRYYLAGAFSGACMACHGGE
jgi:hypothetical protein